MEQARARAKAKVKAKAKAILVTDSVNSGPVMRQ
jgi:hypothetical protein